MIYDRFPKDVYSCKLVVEARGMCMTGRKEHVARAQSGTLPESR